MAVPSARAIVAGPGVRSLNGIPCGSSSERGLSFVSMLNFTLAALAARAAAPGSSLPGPVANQSA